MAGSDSQQMQAGKMGSMHVPATVLVACQEGAQYEVAAPCRPTVTWVYLIWQSNVCRVPSGGQLKQAGCKMAADACKPKESGEERAAQIRVLIAEDNMINMKVAMGILRRMGYEQVPFPPAPHIVTGNDMQCTLVGPECCSIGSSAKSRQGHRDRMNCTWLRAYHSISFVEPD